VLEHAVIAFPFLLRWHFFGEPPVLNDLLVFDPVKIDVDARVALMRSSRGDEDEVSLSQHESDFIDGPVFRDHFEITQERRQSITHAGFVANLIFSDVARDLAVVSTNMDGLVIVANDGLVLLGVL
jgi:hypothetical protein